LVGLMLIASAAVSQPVRIHSNTDSLRVGQLFDVYVVFDNPATFQRIVLPDSTSFSDPFEFKNRSRGLTAAGSDSVRIQLQFFGSKDTLITGLEAFCITDTDTLLFEIADYPIYFVSTVPDESELRPLKPLFAFAGSIWPWILAIAVLLIVLLSLYYYRKKRQQKPEPKPEPEPVSIPHFVHPHKQLIDGITKLEMELQKGNIEYQTFYVQSGDLIRQYLESTHSFPAMEQTTREALQNMYRITTNNRLINQTRDMLQEADMVKFAKFIPDFDRMAEMIVKLRFFADQVRRDDDLIFRKLQAEHNQKYRVQQTGEVTP